MFEIDFGAKLLTLIFILSRVFFTDFFFSLEVHNCFQNETKITYNKDEIGFETHY